jgi:xanthine dehydrogenase molybdopterin-binding subunit B
VAEVYVDTETGQVHLRKLNPVHDVATILNPVGHQGRSTAALFRESVTLSPKRW